MSKQTVLFVFTSVDKALDGKPIGWYLPEAAHPYYALADKFNIVSSSPKGGLAPVDDSSVENFKDEESVRFLEGDAVAKKLWSETRKITDVNAADYAAIFFVGGHGPMIDLAFDKDSAKLIQDFYVAKKPIAAVCHGPAALTAATKPGSSESILSAVKVTGFSNTEEAQTPYNDFVNILPFSLEDKLRDVGGKYEKGADWTPNVVWDGGILTGQNPASAAVLGRKLREILA